MIGIQGICSKVVQLLAGRTLLVDWYKLFNMCLSGLTFAPWDCNGACMSDAFALLLIALHGEISE